MAAIGSLVLSEDIDHNIISNEALMLVNLERINLRLLNKDGPYGTMSGTLLFVVLAAFFLSKIYFFLASTAFLD